MHKRDNRQPTVDITMRLIMPLLSYRQVGQIMDEINVHVSNVLGTFHEARFDFVSFNTNPCKAIDMDDARYAGETSMGDDSPISEYDELRTEVTHLRRELAALRQPHRRPVVDAPQGASGGEAHPTPMGE